MKTIKFLLFAIFSISMCIACSEKDSTDEPDFQGELRTKAALENMLLGQWAEVSPTKNGCIISFMDDELIFNQNVYKGFSDTVSCVYQVLTGELIQIAIGDKSADYKVAVYDDDNITIKEFIPADAAVSRDIKLQRVPPVIIEPEEPVSKNDSLAGTQWKLAGIVDAKTGEMKTLEPKDCEICYTLDFRTLTAFSTFTAENQLYGAYEVNYAINDIHFADYEGYIISENGDGNLYRNTFYSVQSFSLQENELKLYFEQENKQYYLLYNQPEAKGFDNFYSDKIIGKWELVAQGYYDEENNPIINPVEDSWQYIEFFSNGKMEKPYFSDGKIVATECPYKIDAQFLYENYTDEKNAFLHKYDLDNDKLTLTCIQGNILAIPFPKLITVYQRLKE